MINNKTIAVVVPAYNEEKQIGRVIKTMPDFVDRIVVVNDCSTDKTADIVKKYIENDNTSSIVIKEKTEKIDENIYNKPELIIKKIKEKEKKYYIPTEITNKTPDNDRIILINHLKNGKKGKAVANGFLWCREHNIDCIAIMDGDGQMDPSELESICRPVIEDKVDYVKGNRLVHLSSYQIIPKIRYFGNSVLSLFTKIASGYWHVSDTQTGYIAISLKAVKSIKLHKIYKDYGLYNDLLVKLNISYCVIKEIEIKPIYDIGEKSKMKIWKVIPKISLLLVRLFFYRLWKKYFLQDLHPIFFLYHLAFLLFLIDIPVIIKIINDFFSTNFLTFQTLITFLFLTSFFFFSLFFAMWMDIQDNERLYK